MAQSFLATHGIDLDAELERLQTPPNQPAASKDQESTIISNVTLPNTTHASDVTITGSKITSIKPHEHSSKSPDSDSAPLLAPSLCHPHIHLDKPYLLSHPRFASSQTLTEGTFAEAMFLTSSAKHNFTREDLLERGQRLLDESIAAGVTHMRAFVEIDAVVGSLCLQAGRELRKAAAGTCIVQLCAFAQEPIFSGYEGDADGSIIRSLLASALSGEEKVSVIGSTPYVETSRSLQGKNISYMIDLAISHKVHLDFHLDYNLDPTIKPMIWFVIETLKAKDWTGKNSGRTIVLGHCTRLSLFTPAEWQELRSQIGDLPVSFVGLPSSDLFMMRNPEQQRTRGTLPIPEMIETYNLNACIGINNIGNAFTPHGSCDPLALASSCVGTYSAGTAAEAEMLYESISTRARKAIGFGGRVEGDDGREARVGTGVRVGDRADLVVFRKEEVAWRTRRSVSEAVYLYDQGRGRRAMLDGKWVNWKNCVVYTQD